MLYLIALIIFVAMLLLSLAICGASISFLFDAFSLVLTLLSIIPMLFVSGMGKDLICSFSVIFKKTDSLTAIQLKRCQAALSLTIKLLLCSGTLLALVSLIAVLGLNPEYIFPNLAVALLSLVYSLVPCFLLLPVQAKITALLINLQRDE